jgi:phenylalanine-4-hydroxylase
MIRNFPNNRSLRPAALSAEDRYDQLFHQPYHRLRAEDHEVWAIMLAQQLPRLRKYADPKIYQQLVELGLGKKIPHHSQLSKAIAHTGFSVAGVRGLMTDQAFFASIAGRVFPVTLWIRKRSEMDYIESPDMTHDLMGHLPQLMSKDSADLLHAFSKACLNSLNPEWCASRGLNELAGEYLRRAYWYCIEYGLSHEGKLFGAGLLSSPGEAEYASTSSEPQRHAFDWKRVLATPYRIDRFQSTYFLLPENLRQLTDALLDDRENSLVISALRGAR